MWVSLTLKDEISSKLQTSSLLGDSDRQVAAHTAHHMLEQTKQFEALVNKVEALANFVDLLWSELRDKADKAEMKYLEKHKASRYTYTYTCVCVCVCVHACIHGHRCTHRHRHGHRHSSETQTWGTAEKGTKVQKMKRERQCVCACVCETNLYASTVRTHRGWYVINILYIPFLFLFFIITYIYI